MLGPLRPTLRQGARSLAAAPGATLAAIGILTLAMAAATITYSVVDAVVLRSLPFHDSASLVAVHGQTPRGRGPVAAVDYLTWAERAHAFESLAAHRGFFDTVAVGSSTERIHGLRTTASLFTVLRTPAFLGRVFGPEHEVSGRDNVAVIGYALWQRLYGGDPGAIGRMLPLRDGPVEIVGVMPRGFTYPVTAGADLPVEIWMPYVVPPDERSLTAGRSSYLQVVGRLQPSATVEQARAEVEAATAPLTAAFPMAYRNWRPVAVPLHEYLVGDVRGWMQLALAAVVLVMLIACANVASFLLTRSADRARELAVRASLGAGRRRLMSASLLESAILFAIAAALGTLIASWGVDVIRSALPGRLARASQIALDWRVLGTAWAAAFASAAIAGVVPAWQASRVDVLGLLQSGGAAVTVGRRRWRSALLVVEVAFVSVLLVTMALFVGSFLNVTQVDLGFDRTHLVVAGPLSGVRDRVDTIAEEIRVLPGVAGAAVLSGTSAPLIAASGFGGGAASVSLQPLGRETDAAPVSAEVHRVSPEYFDVMRIPVRAGRGFVRGDPSSSSPVVVLDEIAARRLAGGRDPLGMQLNAGGRGGMTMTVIGVSASVRARGPERDSLPQLYLPLGSRGGAPHLVIRTSKDAEAVRPAIEAVLARHASTGAPARVIRIEEAFSRLTAERRFNASVMSVFGVLALLIGAAGVYGVMASSVAQRTREIGIRAALGATAARIVASVFADAARCLLPGLALGLLAAWMLSRTFSALLFEIHPTDMAVYLTAAAVLVTAGLLAAVLPARRAARVDPLVALREL